MSQGMTTTLAGNTPPVTEKRKKNLLSDGQGTLAAILISPTMLVILFVVGIPILLSLRESVVPQEHGRRSDHRHDRRHRELRRSGQLHDIFRNPTNVVGAWGTMDRLVNSFLNVTLLHRGLCGDRDHPRRGDGTDHAPGLPRQGLRPCGHPDSVGDPHDRVGAHVGPDLRRRRRDEQAPRPAGPMAGGQQLLAVGGGRRRHMEDGAVHRPAHVGGPPDDSGGRLRGGEGRRGQRLADLPADHAADGETRPRGGGPVPDARHHAYVRPFPGA